MAEYHNVFPKATLSLNEKSMVQGKRLAITTAVGILTGLYCAGSLLIAAPPGTIPEAWFVATILYGRVAQGFVIGFADGIPLHPLIRGAGLGAIMSLELCIMPLFAHNLFGAVMLLVFGIIYGVIADGIASWACREKKAPK
jgi:hypothetical protein